MPGLLARSLACPHVPEPIDLEWYGRRTAPERVGNQQNARRNAAGRIQGKFSLDKADGWAYMCVRRSGQAPSSADGATPGQGCGVSAAPRCVGWQVTRRFVMNMQPVYWASAQEWVCGMVGDVPSVMPRVL